MFRRIYWKAIPLALGLIFVFSALPGTGIAHFTNHPKPVEGMPGMQQTGNVIYIPNLSRGFPPPQTIFGVEVGTINDAHGFDKAEDANIYWVRNIVIDWASIEPTRTTPPVYDWSSVDIAGLKRASSTGKQVIAMVKNAPAWAQGVPGYLCGKIASNQLDAFAQFMHAAVQQFSPYVRYWELGNEPDVDPSDVAPDSVYGCWGDENDAYYGGGYYAEMLKRVYPEIKTAAPNAQVLIGGLLLDCDPGNPPSGTICTSGKFFEGILKGGGGSYFDIVSFHGYPPFKNDPNDNQGPLYEDEHYYKWKHRGGVVLGKINFLQQTMALNNVSKPIMHTEGALICPEWDTVNCKTTPSSVFFEAQADYVIWLFVRNWAVGVQATTWFTLNGPGWRYSGLLDGNQQPKPAYHAYKFMVQELGKARFAGLRSEYLPNLRAYEFTVTGKRIWVVWSADEMPRSFRLPPGVLKILDKYGNPITPGGNTMNVSSPIYVELSP